MIGNYKLLWMLLKVELSPFLLRFPVLKIAVTNPHKPHAVKNHFLWLQLTAFYFVDADTAVEHVEYGGHLIISSHSLRSEQVGIQVW